jgi:hypothetical protein
MCYALQKHTEMQLFPGKCICKYFSIHFGMDLYVPVLNSTLLHLPPTVSEDAKIEPKTVATFANHQGKESIECFIED